MSSVSSLRPPADDRVQRQQRVVAQVAASPLLRSGDLGGLARLLTELAARELGIERVSVWLYRDAHTTLELQDLYLLARDEHQQGVVLHEAAFAAEFAALREAKVIDADDPYTDPRTQGYAEPYLKPNRITAMLDAVVRLGEELIGLVCFEHVDRPHRWSEAEVAFASQMADQMALAVVIARKRQVMEQLRLRDAELQALNTELEQRVADRSAALQSAQLALAAAQQQAQLGKVLAGVAHELNSPLGNALLMAGTLSGQAQQFAQQDGPLSRRALADFLQAQRQGAQLVERSLQRAVELVQSLKNVASDQASGERRRFRLAAVVQDVLDMLGPGLRRHRCQVQLRVEIDPQLQLDSYPGPLGQIVINLVNNALLHGFEGRERGSIAIRGEAIGTERCRLSVADDGVGMAPAQRERLFEAFQSSRYGDGGCGLGLHLVQQLASAALGGSAQLDERHRPGCRFNIDLPLSAPR